MNHVQCYKKHFPLVMADTSRRLERFRVSASAMNELLALNASQLAWLLTKRGRGGHSFAAGIDVSPLARLASCQTER